jgi:hypothetical protein
MTLGMESVTAMGAGRAVASRSRVRAFHIACSLARRMTSARAPMSSVRPVRSSSHAIISRISASSRSMRAAPNTSSGWCATRSHQFSGAGTAAVRESKNVSVDARVPHSSKILCVTSPLRSATAKVGSGSPPHGASSAGRSWAPRGRASYCLLSSGSPRATRFARLAGPLRLAAITDAHH